MGKGVTQQVIHHDLLVIQQLLADDGFEIRRWRCLALGERDQLLQIAGGHQKTDQFPVASMRYINPGNVAGSGDVGPTTHTGIQRPGKHQMIGKPSPADAVIGTFRDGKTQVQRVAERIKILTLLQHRQLVRQLKRTGAGTIHAHDGQIAQHIKSD